MAEVPFWAIPATLVIGIAVGWALTAESRRLAHEDKQWWRHAALDAGRRATAMHREVVRLRNRYRPVGFAPYRKPCPAPNGWPDPEPSDLIRRLPDPNARPAAVVRGLPAAPPKAPPAPAWCHEPLDPERPDPEGELVGGVFHLDHRLVHTSELDLSGLMTGAA